MKEISFNQVGVNLPLTLEENKMLITLRHKDKVNTMTAGWGGFGVLWKKPCAFIFVRPQRYTYTLLEKEEYFSLNFLSTSWKKELAYLGTASGRDENKISKVGFTLCEWENVPYFAEADTNLICRKLYRDVLAEEKFVDTSISPTIYPDKDFHIVYIAEIEKVFQKEG